MNVKTKKFFALNVAILLLAVLSPTAAAEAITSNQIGSAVMVICPDAYRNNWNGTGTVIDPKGIILTNKHLVTDEKGAIIPSCFIGFISNPQQEPDFGSVSDPNVAEVKYYTTDPEMDAAVLYFDNKQNRTLSYVDIWNSDSSRLQLGEIMEIVGFPTIGGRTITYSSGVFSGFGGPTDNKRNYLKTDAPIEHGNSGGAAYDAQGEYMGIPSQAVAGLINSLSYILSINSVKDWLKGILGPDYATKITEQPVLINQVPGVLPPDITAPDISQVQLAFYDCGKNYSGRDSLGNLLPTHLPILKNDCTEIPYDPEKIYPYSAETIWVDISEPAAVSSDIAKWNSLWSNQPDAKPITDRKIYRDAALPEGFSQVFPASVAEGDYFYSLQLVDATGNVSEAKIWKYRYRKPIASAPFSPALVSRLSGRILLQVQSLGEAWYVNPNDGLRYYMKDGAAAFNLMRKFALGITNKDLAKISQDKEVRVSDVALTKRLAGKILLQIEHNGDAWYVNPVSGTRYFMGKPDDAYTLMRTLGLGITNQDLEKIPIGTLE